MLKQTQPDDEDVILPENIPGPKGEPIFRLTKSGEEDIIAHMEDKEACAKQREGWTVDYLFGGFWMRVR